MDFPFCIDTLQLSIDIFSICISSFCNHHHIHLFSIVVVVIVLGVMSLLADWFIRFSICILWFESTLKFVIFFTYDANTIFQSIVNIPCFIVVILGIKFRGFNQIIHMLSRRYRRQNEIYTQTNTLVRWCVQF